jgi:hypothetical protein
METIVDFDDLYSEAKIKFNTANFSEGQLAKLKLACHKTVLENPELDKNECLIALSVYYNYIRDFPDLEF